jgi:glycosyltransferase involved in cell wall biosynthesis
MKDITIIMPFLNEELEPQRTIDSIYETAHPKRFQIIAIDDCSKNPPEIRERREITYIKNNKRIGVDACRQMGADLAKTSCLFIMDAHMRFTRGWLSCIINDIYSEPNTLWCTTCMGLGYGNMDINRSRDYYRGADIVLHNKENEILEPKWRNIHGNGSYEIPCVLGANYGVSAQWFKHIHGLQGLQMWGGSEMFMSLKTWMAGGTCKINTDIKIGHKFRDTAPYSTNIWNMIYNKIFMCKTILSEDIGEYLIRQIPRNVNYRRAEKEIQKRIEYISQEREYYQGIFNRNLKSICDKWLINMPVI